MNDRDRLLRELRSKIEAEVEYVDVKPYSHNLISIYLRQISKEFGDEVVNRIIDDFELESLGWTKVESDEYNIKEKKETETGT